MDLQIPDTIFKVLAMDQGLQWYDAPRHTPGYRCTPGYHVVQRPLAFKNVFSSVMIAEISGYDAEAVQVHNKKA